MRAFAIVVCCCLVASCASTPVAQSAPPALAGSAWQLVRISQNDVAIAPDARASYTLSFDAGSVAARIDCNRGHAAWSSAAPGALALGPLALTRALCPPDSLHDRLVADWSSMRAYRLESGHLFIRLTGAQVTYEWEPLPAAEAHR